MMDQQRLQSYCVGLESDKVTERRKSLEELRGALDDPDVVRSVNDKSRGRDSSSGRHGITWDILLKSSHAVVLKETVCLRQTVQKLSSTTVINKCENTVKACTTLLATVVRKASTGAPLLTGGNLVTFVIDVLSDDDHLGLQHYVGSAYLSLLLNQIMPERKYWTSFSADQWTRLFSLCIVLYQSPPPHAEKTTILQAMYYITQHGCSQSFLELTVKKNFLFLEESFNDRDLNRFISLQAALLQLAILFCTQLALESRTAICKFGEMCLPKVLLLYRVEGHMEQKHAIFDFLLLQIRVHHPHGAREGEGAAYAYSWDEWRRHLRSIYNVVETELSKNKQYRFVASKPLNLQDNLLQLAVSVCLQISGNSNDMVEVTQLASTSTGCAPKRRRILVGIPAIMDTLGTSTSVNDNWPWLAVLGALMAKQPTIVDKSNFVPLLQLVNELQSACKDSVIMNYLCKCCASLLKVEKELLKCDDNSLDSSTIQSLWKKIWETTLRTIGLNQSEEGSHMLVQALIIHGVIRQATALLHMFLTGTIKLSVHSLKTLEIVFKFCNIPDIIETQQNVWRMTSSQSSTRHALLNWLLPVADDTSITEQVLASLPSKLHSHVLVEVVLKRRLASEKPESGLLFVAKSDPKSIQDDFALSSFENGLLVNTDWFSPAQKLPNNSQLLVDIKAKEMLFETINLLCTPLAETKIHVSTNTSGNFIAIMNLINHTELLVQVLSKILRLKIESWNNILQERSVQLLRQLIVEITTATMLRMKNAAKFSYTSNEFYLLRKLTQLYQAEIDEDLCDFIREAVADDFLQMAFSFSNMSSSKRVQKESATADDVEFDQTDGDYTHLESNDDSSSPVLKMKLLPDNEKVQLEAVNLLCAFSCATDNYVLNERRNLIMKKFASIVVGDGFDLQTSMYNFQVAVRIVRSMLSLTRLQQGHIEQILEIIQKLCKSRHTDADASIIIIGLFQDLLKHMGNENLKNDRANMIELLKHFKKKIGQKKYGPKVCAQFIKCLNDFAKADPSLLWALWDCGTKIANTKECFFPAASPIIEEVLVHLASPFHELRMIAASAIAMLFGGVSGQNLDPDKKHEWEISMFDKLCVVIVSSFVVEGELTISETADESANRTASALHSLAALIVVSPRCRRKALFIILQLVKDKNVNAELVHKVLKIVGKNLKLPTIKIFMEKNLNYLLVHWLELYQLVDFPWQLVGCATELEFYTKFQEVIVPVLLQKEDGETLDRMCQTIKRTVSQLLEMCYPRVMACFLPCYAIGNSDLFGVTDLERRIAQRLYKKMGELLGKERVDNLLTIHLCGVIVSIVRLLFDPEHLYQMCGCRETLPDPDPPYYSAVTVSKTFEYLQENSPCPDLALVEFLDSDLPEYIQKILLLLSVDIHEAPTLEDRLTALHRYVTFADTLLSANLQKMAHFTIRDITHTLVDLVKRSWNCGENVLASAACHYLLRFCRKCLPNNASILEDYVNNIVGVLIPIATIQSKLGTEAAKLIKFLIVENSDCFLRAIQSLDPFPNDEVFEDVHKVYMRINHRGSMSILEVEIQHFLKTGSGKHGCQAESLIHIWSKLSEKKLELNMMYKELEEMRGFSEDCANSLLHQLICKLVKLTANPNTRICIEAARCLGELGPADLTTIVLKPEVNLGKADYPVLAFSTLVINLLVGCLVDEDIPVIQAASSALYTVLATEEGKRSIGSVDPKYRKVIVPFQINGTQKGPVQSRIPVDEAKFKQLIDNELLWCPSAECSHEKWITELVVSLLQTFSANSFLSQLIPVSLVKVSFSEEILPHLVHLVLCSDNINCSTIISRSMRLFFSKQFNKLQPDKHMTPAGELRTSKNQVCFNRASVQCMLNVVHFIRLQRSDAHKSQIQQTSLDLNYLHVALAAQFCFAYFTSILYAELWCSTCKSRGSDEGDHDTLQSFSTLDYILSKDPEGGKAVQNLLREAYTKMGDSDAVYGCGSSHLLDPHTRVRHYELLGKWQDVVLQYDVELSSGNQATTRGMLMSLEKFGLHHLLHAYQDARTNMHSDHKQDDFYYDSLWRLSQWNVSVETGSLQTNAPEKQATELLADNNEFRKYRYLSLKALRNKDEMGLENSVHNARRCVVESLAYASLESSKNLYPALSQLQALQEIEDFASAVGDGRFDGVFQKWKYQDQRNYNEFSYLEPILAQRSTMLNIMIEKETADKNILTDMLIEIQMGTAVRARHEGSYQVAVRSLGQVNILPDLTPNIAGKLKLEEAHLSWENGDQDVGKFILQSILRKFSLTPPRSQSEISLYSLALQLYGNWMVETKSENPQIIIDRYFLKSLSVLSSTANEEQSRIQTYASLAHFADVQYQQVTSYLQSSEMERKRQNLEKFGINVQNLRQDMQKPRSDTRADPQDKKRAIDLTNKLIRIDEGEIENMENDKDKYLLLAMKYYMLSLEQCNEEKHNLQVFRFVSLWLENQSHQELDKMLAESLSKIPSYKFLLLLPQVAPRMGNSKTDPFDVKINQLLERCAKDHPHHTLPLILALANSFKDKDVEAHGKADKTTEPRVLGAKQMILRLRKNPQIGLLVQRMEQMSEALIELANLDAKVKTNNLNSLIPVPKNAQLHKLRNLDMVLVPSVNTPVRNNGEYTDIVGIQEFDTKYSLVGGVNAPKKLVCLGTDGIKRPHLLKGKDDLRQDAVMQQVFTMMNAVLKNNKETNKRKLVIRTYKVVPLSHRSGILEWCENTDPIGYYLIPAHKRYYPKDLPVAECRRKLQEAASKSTEQKLQVYQEIASRLHPVFHYFFLENFPTPGIWFERRQAYTQSVATSSMIGYILGLGDRHVQNILIDRNTAEVIHIDFGIAFEQGKVLPIPETVPFRLSRDIEDAMGVSGIEGVFRRSCEKTMSVLRQNQETILTILEVLLYDPLYAWSITPAKAFNMQQPHRAKATVDSQASPVEVNKLAERALLRLKLKLQGTEEGVATSVQGQVNRLIQQARDPGCLSRLFAGWQAYL